MLFITTLTITIISLSILFSPFGYLKRLEEEKNPVCFPVNSFLPLSPCAGLDSLICERPSFLVFGPA